MELTFRDVFLPFKAYVSLNLRLLSKRSLRTVVVYSIIVLSGLTSWFFIIASAQLRATILKGDAFGPLITALLLLFLPFSFWRGYKKMYQSSALLQAPATYRLSDEEVQVISPLANSQASWQTVNELYLLGHYAVLMNSTVTGYFLDFRCLEAPATKADFLALVQRQNIKIK